VKIRVPFIIRMQSGFEVNSETLALEFVKRVGPSGNFMAEEHTMHQMRSELFQPLLSDRDCWEKWSTASSPDTRARARKLAADYLKNHEPQGLTPDREKDILSAIDGIVRNPR
jgi:trimethylamine--corrinoid protein Co-methyltransferase